MPLTKTNKEEIIQTTLTVFRRNGYYKTSMSDLATACGLQKGSFYHYFASKEVLMAEVLKSVKSYLDYAVFSISKETGISTRDKMEKMLLKLGKTLLSQEGGCIVGNTTLEVAGQSVIFKETLKGIFDSWKEAMKTIFMEEYPETTSSRLAEQSIMEFEGAVMFSQLYETDQYLKDVFVRTLSKMK
ncbi:TetR/AcrR family transcriptional regulator [uncultured Arcticibacterium sp.]|uniref:TetR/AcrR family transcriptional regulator n=1 Tax=uncultured Arcticibacterium sp. TaxID=2173042 RepID=UPI0030FCD48B